MTTHDLVAKYQSNGMSFQLRDDGFSYHRDGGITPSQVQTIRRHSRMILAYLREKRDKILASYSNPQPVYVNPDTLPEYQPPTAHIWDELPPRDTACPKGHRMIALTHDGRFACRKCNPEMCNG